MFLLALYAATEFLGVKERTVRVRVRVCVCAFVQRACLRAWCCGTCFVDV